ncbi:hypothetical protein PYCC9005_003444 [Savitreella phatthalungensis]
MAPSENAPSQANVQSNQLPSLTSQFPPTAPRNSMSIHSLLGGSSSRDNEPAPPPRFAPEPRQGPVSPTASRNPPPHLQSPYAAGNGAFSQSAHGATLPPPPPTFGAIKEEHSGAGYRPPDERYQQRPPLQFQQQGPPPSHPSHSQQQQTSSQPTTQRDGPPLQYDHYGPPRPDYGAGPPGAPPSTLPPSQQHMHQHHHQHHPQQHHYTYPPRPNYNEHDRDRVPLPPRVPDYEREYGPRRVDNGAHGSGPVPAQPQSTVAPPQSAPATGVTSTQATVPVSAPASTPAQAPSSAPTARQTAAAKKREERIPVSQQPLEKRMHHFEPPSASQQSSTIPPAGNTVTSSHKQAPQQAAPLHSVFRKANVIVNSLRVFEEAKLYPECKLGTWTYDPTVRLPFKLRVNAVFDVLLPRRYLLEEHNHAIRRRKVWGTDIYTDDSDIAAMLLHAIAEQRMPRHGDLLLKVRVMPRLLRYKGTMKNTLRSRGWNAPHDGLSLFLENVQQGHHRDEVKGIGFAKRKLQEDLELRRVSAKFDSVVNCDWRPTKFRKTDRDHPSNAAAPTADKSASDTPATTMDVASSAQPEAADTEDEMEEDITAPTPKPGTSLPAQQPQHDADVTVDADDQSTEAAEESIILSAQADKSTDPPPAGSTDILPDDLSNDKPGPDPAADPDVGLNSVKPDVEDAKKHGNHIEQEAAEAEQKGEVELADVPLPQQPEPRSLPKADSIEVELPSSTEKAAEKPSQKSVETPEKTTTDSIPAENSASKKSDDGPAEMTADSAAKLDREAASAIGVKAIDAAKTGNEAVEQTAAVATALEEDLKSNRETAS